MTRDEIIAYALDEAWVELTINDDERNHATI